MAKSSFRFTAWQSAYIKAITEAVQRHFDSTEGWNADSGFDVQILASDVITDDEPTQTDITVGTFQDLVVQMHPRDTEGEVHVGRSALAGDLLVHKRKSSLGFTYYDVLVTGLTENGEIVG